MSDSNGSISRREALKTTAKAAGVAAFATPVVVGVFNSKASAIVCTTANDSDAITAQVISANYEWNHNSGTPAAPAGRYNGQNKNFTLNNGTGTVQVGATGTDNPPVQTSYYVIFPPAGFASCSATWQVVGCTTGTILWSSGALTTNQGPLPYCSNAADPQTPAVQLQLVSVTCCPSPR